MSDQNENTSDDEFETPEVQPAETEPEIGHAAEDEPAGVDVEERGIDPQEVLDEADTGDGDGGSDKPDPSEVEPLTHEETVHQRDEDGVLIPETGVIEFPDGWRRVKHKPLTRGMLNRFEEHFGDGEDVDWEEMDETIADFYVDPEYEPDEFDDVDPGYYIPLMTFIVEQVEGEIDDDVTQQLSEEVAERQTESEGN